MRIQLEERNSSGTTSTPEKSDLRGYSTWEQVAGYFDGDGSPKAHMNVYTITLSVSWADQDIEIIQHVAQFLRHMASLGRQASSRVERAPIMNWKSQNEITL